MRLKNIRIKFSNIRVKLGNIEFKNVKFQRSFLEANKAKYLQLDLPRLDNNTTKH